MGRTPGAKNKSKPIVAVAMSKPTLMEEKMKYLKNCLFWMNEYNEGRESKEKLEYTITAIEIHCAEIRNKILPKKQVMKGRMI